MLLLFLWWGVCFFVVVFQFSIRVCMFFSTHKNLQLSNIALLQGHEK